MATITEMQKARELMKTQGLDLKTAVAQARTPVTPANPTTPIPITDTPVTPQPIVQAPIDTTTGLSKPLEQTTTPTQTPVAQTTKSEQDINKQYG
jgi:hypothetical protein